MKKIILSLSLGFLGTFTYAQGLDSIIVEKYYVANAADAAGSVGTLPVGSVTYRVFADLKPGYLFQALFGTANTVVSPPVPIHTLLINTSTTFFNNEDRGKTSPEGIDTKYLKTNTVALDSWFSVGGTAIGQMGILKSEDNGAANLISANTLLKNNAISMGIPLTTQDGMVAGSPVSVTFVGLTTELNVFDGTSQVGNSFSTSNGSIAALGGAQGPDSATFNRVLIGQFTTDGVFHFELNLQLGTPTGGIENYAANNIQSGEFTHSSLIYTSPTVNTPPTVSITAPATASSYTVGSVVNIAASAADADGTVDSVQFFVDGVKIGKDISSPYTYTVTSAVGTHTLTAIATDNNGANTTSTAVTYVIISTNNISPTVSITTPMSATSYSVGASVAIAATAADADGTVDSVQFFVDGTKVGKAVTAPYTYTVVAAVGTHTLTAVAIDNLGAHTTSASVIYTGTPITGIIELVYNNPLLTVYPNPSTDFITISINTSTPSVASYSIYDLLGNTILTTKLGNISGNYQEKINVSSFTPGQYILALTLDGVISTKKIIIN